MKESIESIKLKIAEFEREKRMSYDLIKKSKDILLKMEPDYNEINEIILSFKKRHLFNHIVLISTFVLGSFTYGLSEEKFIEHINGYNSDKIIGLMFQTISVVVPIISYINNYINNSLENEFLDYLKSDLNELEQVKAICEFSIKEMKKAIIEYDKMIYKLKKSLVYLENRYVLTSVENSNEFDNISVDNGKKVKIKRK